MADMEQVAILKVTTVDSAKSVGDLRENIRKLNAILNETTKDMDKTEDETKALTIGTDEYKLAVKQLTENQTALRNALNGTSASLDDVKNAAKGVGTTYNSLVSQMKTLKQEIRNVDVSTDEGQKKFASLALQIQGVNDQLKAMDADMGNYQRNVGNYTSAFDNFGKVVQGLPPFMNRFKQAGENVNKTMKLLSTNPVVGFLVLLAPLIQKVVEKLKETHSVTNIMSKAFKALKPVFDVLEKALKKIEPILSTIFDWLGKILGEVFRIAKPIVEVIAGIGTVIVQFILAPIQKAASLIQLLWEVLKSKGEPVKWAANMAAFLSVASTTLDTMLNFEENYLKGRDFVRNLFDGIEDETKKPENLKPVKTLSEKLKAELNNDIEDATETVDAYIERMKKANAARMAQLNEAIKREDEAGAVRLRWNQILEDDDKKRAANAYAIQEAANQAKLDLLKKYREEALAAEDYEGAAEMYRKMMALEVQMEQDALEEKKRIRKEDAASAKASMEKRIALTRTSADSIAGLLGAIADAYEATSDGDQKAAKKAKALRITEAVINTISGALAAYTSAQSLGFPMGPIIGAINAAAVTATGVANIAKIKSTPVGSGGSSGGSEAGVSSAALVAAPSTPVTLPEVRNITTASEEDRLDRMASDQKVYILNSDLEANTDYHKAQVAEATF